MGFLKSVIKDITAELVDEQPKALAAAEAAMAKAIEELEAKRLKTTFVSRPVAPEEPMPLSALLERRAGSDRREADIPLPEGFEDRRSGIDRRDGKDRRAQSSAFGRRAVKIVAEANDGSAKFTPGVVLDDNVPRLETAQAEPVLDEGVAPDIEAIEAATLHELELQSEPRTAEEAHDAKEEPDVCQQDTVPADLPVAAAAASEEIELQAELPFDTGLYTGVVPNQVEDDDPLNPPPGVLTAFLKRRPLKAKTMAA